MEDIRHHMRYKKLVVWRAFARNCLYAMFKDIAKTESNTRALSPHCASIILALVTSFLLMAGCDFAETNMLESEQHAMRGPVPPLQPARFADFSGRADVPDRIVIPSIELDTSVVDVGWSAAADSNGSVVNHWDVAEYAAGWHANSDRLGQGGNVVLSGHNNMLGAVFREMDRLEVGDVAMLWSGDIRYDYEIAEVHIVPEQGAPMEQRRKNARWIGEFDDDRLTLVTCWPRGGNSHRIIAVGHLVGGATGFESMVATSQ